MKDPFDYFTHERDSMKEHATTQEPETAMKAEDWKPEEGDLEAHQIENSNGPDELLIMEYGNVDGWVSSTDTVEVKE